MNFLPLPSTRDEDDAEWGPTTRRHLQEVHGITTHPGYPNLILLTTHGEAHMLGTFAEGGDHLHTKEGR